MQIHTQRSAETTTVQQNSAPTFQFAAHRPEAVAQRKLQAAASDFSRQNATGLPDQLKSGIEQLSGYAMDDVNVHYNSDKPSQLQAHAYAQGTDIHLATGQEKHLAHEAWHVVQQKQGRVQPTTQLKGSVNVNDDAGLESEADDMGEKALLADEQPVGQLKQAPIAPSDNPIQGYFKTVDEDSGKTFRVADDYTVIVDSSHTLFAEDGRAAAANLMLEDVHSGIELKQTAATAKLGDDTLYKVEAKNKQNNTEGDLMELYADCGRSNGVVMGNSDRHAIAKDPYNGGAKVNISGKGVEGNNAGMEYADGNPAGMKIQVLQRLMTSIYYGASTVQATKEAIEKVYTDADVVHKQMAEYVRKFKDPANPLKDLNGYWPLLRELSEIYMSLYNAQTAKKKDTIDTHLGINKAANPSVGEGYTMSTGGGGAPTWPFHWAGVIMTSEDNADKVVLENYSVSNWDKQNNKWEFQMYGTQKKDQTFHEEHLASGTHKDKPTTMVVAGN